MEGITGSQARPWRQVSEHHLAGRAGVDRKTARHYVAAAQAAGVVREGGLAQLSDEVIGQVAAAVRPARASGHGQAWEALEAEREQIAEWVGKDLSVVKIADLLVWRGVLVPYRTVHRFCTQRCGLHTPPKPTPTPVYHLTNRTETIMLDHTTRWSHPRSNPPRPPPSPTPSSHLG